MLGKLLEGRYQVVRILSAGGFCQTYLAQDTLLPSQPTCVVKHLMPPSNYPTSLQTLRWLFTGEAQALKKLGNHEQIPQLLAHFEENQEFYLVQEFISGHALNAELQSGYQWIENHVVQLLQEVLGILEFVHSHGLIHRDLKPNNLIRRQSDNRLVLIDFGSVKQAWTQVVTLQGQKINTFAIGLPATISIGTPGYMPIEQERGRPRPNSDIYALGMIAIQALTGVHATQLQTNPDSCELLWEHHCQVAPELACVLNNMVRYHYKERYQSATEVLQALQPIAAIYPPIQPLVFLGQPSNQQEDASQPLGTTAAAPQDTPSQEDTITFDWDEQSEPLTKDQMDDASVPTTRKKSAMLIDMGIAFTAALALMIGIYYSLRSPSPAWQIQNYPVSIPLKGNSP